MYSSRGKLIAVFVAIAMISVMVISCVTPTNSENTEDGDWNYWDNTNFLYPVELTDKVGIGTDSPTEKLDVNGTVKVRGLLEDNTLDDIVVADADGVLCIRDASTFDGGGGGAADADWLELGVASPTNTGEIYHMGNVLIGANEQPSGAPEDYELYVTGGDVYMAGKLGVGDYPDPAAQLNVDGSVRADGYWLDVFGQCFGNPNGPRMCVVSGTQMDLYSDANTMTLRSGNVGIGTTTPDANYKLHVQGGNQAIYGIATAGTYESRPFGVVADVNTGAAVNTGGGFLTSITTSNTPNIPYVFGGQFWVEDYGNKHARALTLGLTDMESDDFGLEILVDWPGYAIYSSGTGTAYFHGDLVVDGNKLFVQAHPTDPTKEILYACLEGPEAGTYIRGTAELVNGEAVVNLPEHFSLVTGGEGLTVQLTPVGEWLQLYVVEKGTQRIVVREANGKNGQFDYLVQGVRKGYENYQVIRDKE